MIRVIHMRRLIFCAAMGVNCGKAGIGQ